MRGLRALVLRSFSGLNNNNNNGVTTLTRKCDCRRSQHLWQTWSIPDQRSFHNHHRHQLDYHHHHQQSSPLFNREMIMMMNCPTGSPSTRRHQSSHVTTGSSGNNGTGSSTPTAPSVTSIPKCSARNVVVTSRKVIVEAYSRRMEDRKLLSKEERREFSAVFPALVQDIVGAADLRDMPDTNRWMARVLQYNVPHGKLNRGLALALAYRYLTNELTEENIHLSYVLGWCVEILQAFFLVADDIMDGSEMRRGQPCWYRVEGTGPAALNDALMLEATMYPLLKKYFRKEDYYVDLLELFHDVTFKTTYGQSLDTRTGLKKQLDEYTPDLYAAIVKYKTSYYTFYLPVALAMTMAGLKEPSAFAEARGILLDMGHFFQVQDDYLDVYGDPEVMGKIGTDIADGKCSWVVVTALQGASEAERQIILENYGRNEPERIEACKSLFSRMGIPQLYAAYEEETFNLLNSRIQSISSHLPKKLFRDMLEKIYGRSS